MAKGQEVRQIVINSILGGEAPFYYYGAEDQFWGSKNINPIRGAGDYAQPTGLIEPVPSRDLAATATMQMPRWIKADTKSNTIFVYDSRGSAYTLTNTTYFADTTTALSDGGTLSSSSGNGCEYYDNYMYFAKNTDIARYGPLDGAAAFTGTYWTGTLGKAALINTTYPSGWDATMTYPNHVLHRHSDGRLYITDVVGNQGTIHYIATTKGAVEGDTNNGSTASILTFGYGLWPTALESYGSDLVIALYEKGRNAKVAFWDTTSSNANKITWVEFPDPIVSALKNVNGILYAISGAVKEQALTFAGRPGIRISRFIGGYTFQQVIKTFSGSPSFAGAVDGKASRLLVGTRIDVPRQGPCVLSVGTERGDTFHILSGALSAGVATAVLCPNNTYMSEDTPIMGHGSDTSTNIGLRYVIVDGQTASTFAQVPASFSTQLYPIGKSFKITKVRFSLSKTPPVTDTGLYVYLFTDKMASGDEWSTTVNTTNYPDDSGGYPYGNIILRPNKVVGRSWFRLEFFWDGAYEAKIDYAIQPPIVIEYELLDD